MSKDRHSSELKKAHNDGEKDASNGTHHEPYGLFKTIGAGFAGKDLGEMAEENEAYEKGHKNYFKQK